MSEDFDLFWQRYPRKIGKLKARTAYDRALKHASAATILVGLERVKRGWATKEAQFIPHATTWLARGGWEDEDAPTHMNGSSDPLPPMIGYYARDESPELEAWDRYWMSKRGVHAPRDKHFGYWFPTRWPPS